VPVLGPGGQGGEPQGVLEFGGGFVVAFGLIRATKDSEELAQAPVGSAFDRSAQGDDEQLSTIRSDFRHKLGSSFGVAELGADFGQVTDGEWEGPIAGDDGKVIRSQRLEVR
jgi:hypothetical protein